MEAEESQARVETFSDVDSFELPAEVNFLTSTTLEEQASSGKRIGRTASIARDVDIHALRQL